MSDQLDDTNQVGLLHQRVRRRGYGLSAGQTAKPARANAIIATIHHKASRSEYQKWSQLSVQLALSYGPILEKRLTTSAARCPIDPWA
jgi:hypothetical protein